MPVCLTGVHAFDACAVARRVTHVVQRLHLKQSAGVAHRVVVPPAPLRPAPAPGPAPAPAKAEQVAEVDVGVVGAVGGGRLRRPVQHTGVADRPRRRPAALHRQRGLDVEEVRLQGVTVQAVPETRAAHPHTHTAKHRLSQEYIFFTVVILQIFRLK